MTSVFIIHHSQKIYNLTTTFTVTSLRKIIKPKEQWIPLIINDTLEPTFITKKQKFGCKKNNFCGFYTLNALHDNETRLINTSRYPHQEHHILFPPQIWNSSSQTVEIPAWTFFSHQINYISPRMDMIQCTTRGFPRSYDSSVSSTT